MSSVLEDVAKEQQRALTERASAQVTFDQLMLKDAKNGKLAPAEVSELRKAQSVLAISEAEKVALYTNLQRYLKQEKFAAGRAVAEREKADAEAAQLAAAEESRKILEQRASVDRECAAAVKSADDKIFDIGAAEEIRDSLIANGLWRVLGLPDPETVKLTKHLALWKRSDRPPASKSDVINFASVIQSPAAFITTFGPFATAKIAPLPGQTPEQLEELVQLARGLVNGTIKQAAFLLFDENQEPSAASKLCWEFGPVLLEIKRTLERMPAVNPMEVEFVRLPWQKSDDFSAAVAKIKRAYRDHPWVKSRAKDAREHGEVEAARDEE